MTKVKAICQKPQKYKFCVQVPIDVAEAKQLDNDNVNTLWQDTFKKDMENSQVDFQLLGHEDKSPVGYKEIPCHLIFDVKMGLTQKSQYVVGGNLTNPPNSMTYSSDIIR